MLRMIRNDDNFDLTYQMNGLVLSYDDSAEIDSLARLITFEASSA